MVSANNAINNTIGASITGVTNTLTVTNASDTASSAARETITVGGASAGDPAKNFNISGVNDWTQGIDTSDSDKWKLSLGTALGTTDTISILTTGEINFPRNCRFFATVSATIPNVTGDATFYTVIYDTVNFDTNGDYNNATGVFTAPVTGRYFFTSATTITGITAAFNQTNFLFNNTGVVYQPMGLQHLSVHATSFDLHGSTTFQLTAGDTVSILLQISGGAKVASVSAAGYPGTIENIFSGFLLG